jgi:beta-galactosidase/beta-glucuronidase
MKKIWIFPFLGLFITGGLSSATTQNSIPRPEYPRPQFRRSDWMNLNGKWTYCFDSGLSGRDRKLQKSQGFKDEILVPFCPESKLSGVEYKDFIQGMWYHRVISVPKEWAGSTILLHFGGVDYESEIFIDGETAGKHWGGMGGFAVDVTRFVRPGKIHHLVVAVRDDTRSGMQPGGKQSIFYYSWECLYTRTTGIWQTVWIEPVSPYGLKDCQVISDPDNRRFIVNPIFHSEKRENRFRVVLRDGRKAVAGETVAASNGASIALPVSDPKLWSPERPFLYDLTFEVLDKGGEVLDRVESYAGMRKIHIEGNRLFLNNRPIFLRFVLDQGFYPDGIWTAPTDGHLKRDIELSKKAGFNGARLHQKVFEPRFHYWADRLGYLTWGESASWGVKKADPAAGRNFLSEWREIVERDRNHPSIIAWTLFNESGWTYLERDIDPRNWDMFIREQHNRLLTDLVLLTRNLDPTRPVNDASGHVHVLTDIWTVHTYEQNPDTMRGILTPDPKRGVHRDQPEKDTVYEGQPYIVDEYGGIKWAPREMRDNAGESWGYGENPETLEEFYTRLEALTNVLLGFDHISGFCYTQLTDIEQEQNGIYYYDRSEKFDMERIRKIFRKDPVWIK